MHRRDLAWSLILIALPSCADTESSTGPIVESATSTTGGMSSVTPIFIDATADVGLEFAHFSGTSGSYLFPEILGSGVAMFDYDRDGDLDVYLIQANPLDPTVDREAFLFPPPPGQPPGSRLFRNDLVERGTLSFTDVTDVAGVGLQAHGMGAATGDYDRDGDIDLYVTTLTNNVLFRNNGDGTFDDVTSAANVDVPTWSTSASFVDYDHDGDLDLFVTAYVVWSLDLDMLCTSASGNRDYCGPQNYRSDQDHLLRNNGDGTFTDVSAVMGIAGARGAGLGVTAADFNGDGWTDIFVANDGEANHLWISEHGQRFVETGISSGTALNRSGMAEASMGVTAGDYDGDGDEDLFMTHLINETNTLYANDGDGAFTDVTAQARLGFGSRRMTGFGSAWFDYDNDGWLDLFIANGNVKVDEFREGKMLYPFDQPNQLYHNRGDGSFEEIVERAGAATSTREISRGVAFGDIDNDGDGDMIVTNNSGPVRLYLNDIGNEKPWVRVKLVGDRSPPDGSGARIVVHRSGRAPLWRRAHTDGSYLSASEERVLIGLGDDAVVDFIGVIWPSGLRERFDNVPVLRTITLHEGSGAVWPADDPS